MPARTLNATQEQERQQISAKAGLQGAAIGLGLGVVATAVALRRSPDFRTLSRPMQSILAASGTMAGYLFASDRASTAFENQVLGYGDDDTLRVIEQKQEGDEVAPVKMTDKALHYLNDNRWTVIGASWAASMVGALGYSFSNRYLTTQQKLVQARMYAQAVTLVVLMASAGLSMYIGDEKKKTKDMPDAQLRAVLELPIEQDKLVQKL